MIIGLTGRIGSGKTTIARIFERYESFIIDADAIGYVVLEEKKEKIVKEFGKEIVKNGSIDRKLLSEIVFLDKDKLKRLNEITHPLIIKRIKEKVKGSNSFLTIIVAPFLIETSLYSLVDKTILVVCEREKILKRMKNKGWERKDVLRRMENQPPDDERRPFSDIIIDNNGSLSSLERRIKKLIKEELRFKVYEHTADIGIIAFGKTKEEVFENCGFGMFSILADLSNVKCSRRIKVSAEGRNNGEMLVNILSELLFCFTGRNYLLKKFKVEILKRNVSAFAWGERLNKSHRLKMEIKTVTYHNLEIKKRNNNEWAARVIFDV